LRACGEVFTYRGFWILLLRVVGECCLGGTDDGCKQGTCIPQTLSNSVRERENAGAAEEIHNVGSEGATRAVCCEDGVVFLGGGCGIVVEVINYHR
jgi:hypothetical protein